VRERLALRPVLVVSAHAGVTDALLAAARAGRAGKARRAPPPRTPPRPSPRSSASPRPARTPPRRIGASPRGHLSRARGHPAIPRLCPSFGERLAVRTVAQAFTKEGIPARAHDAFDLGLLTDEHFGGADPLPGAEGRGPCRPAGREGASDRHRLHRQTRSGDVTTLGRNGATTPRPSLGPPSAPPRSRYGATSRG